MNKETEVVPKDQIEYYVEFTKVLCIFFAPEQKNTVSSENMPIVKELFDTLIDSFSSKVLQPICSDILTSVEILKGSVKDLRDIQEIVDSTKKKIKMEEEIATNRESKLKQEEKKKVQLLKKYVLRLKKQNLEIHEVINIQRIFKNKFSPPQKKETPKPALLNLDPLNLFTGAQKSDDQYDGILSTKKLIQQIEDSTSPIQLDCLNILTTMLFTEDDLLPPKHKVVTDEEQEELEEKAHLKYISEFGNLGVGVKVLKLLTSKDTKIVSNALKFLIKLLEDGNKEEQDRMLDYFYNSNHAFFEDIRNKLTNGSKFFVQLKGELIKQRFLSKSEDPEKKSQRKRI